MSRLKVVSSVASAEADLHSRIKDKWFTTSNLLRHAGAAAVLLTADAVFADDSPAQSGQIETIASPAAPWGPVPTDKISLANQAPGLVVFFNDGPVFGLPGTVTGDFADRTHLLGDWGGARTELARNGFFFDMYSTSYYQDVTSGGLETGGAFVQNTQLSVNIDTGRAGWWPGGLIHATAQSRLGANPESTFTAGTVVPHYTGLVVPDPMLSDSFLPTEFFLAQALSEKARIVVGKIGTVLLPDQTAYGDSFKYHFANYNLNKNPITTNFFNPSALGAIGVWSFSPEFAIAGGVLDPYIEAEDFVASNSFEKVNLYLTSIMSYDIGGLPGQVSAVYNWSDKPKINLDSPFGTLGSAAERKQAIGSLLGLASHDGLPTHFKDESWFTYVTGSQFLFLKDDAATVARKRKTGEQISGVGVFVRAGYAPEDTNPITSDVSVALFAHGMLDGRDHDSFGAGFYYNKISDKLKTSIATISNGQSAVHDESGMEVFYNFAITPAVRLIPSYQHIWHPLAAEGIKRRDSTDLFQIRLTAAW
jgi:porin